MNEKLEVFYLELKELLNKHSLIMDYMDNYDGNENWCGQTFILRSKEPTNGKYEIYSESLTDFIENGSD